MPAGDFYLMTTIRTTAKFLSLCMLGVGIQATARQAPLRLHPEGSTYLLWQQAAALAPAANAERFDQAADRALAAMRKRVGELGIGGVAVVAWFEGESIQSWTSKMVVLGKLKDEPTASNKGSNLLAIAYSKAAEMADTLKNSGSGVRPPMTGEFGWTGGAIQRGKTGYWIAAFSGGKSEDDLQVSKAGLAVLQ
jgi:hypothetical protein